MDNERHCNLAYSVSENILPPMWLANEHTVWNVSSSGRAPHLLNSIEADSPRATVSKNACDSTLVLCLFPSGSSISF